MACEEEGEHRLTGIGADAFYYDGTGNRLKAVRGGVTTQYVYDANGNLLAEADQTGAITAYYIYGQGLLGRITPGGQSYSYHFDGTGHTVAMTGASGGIVNQYSYSPYGQLLAKQEAIPQPFTYVGQLGVMTEPNGLYYMRARYYDPSTGRFISEDPIGLDGGTNLYAYAANNPVLLNDPNGQCPWCVGAVIGGAIGGTANALGTYFSGGSAGEIATAFAVGAFVGGAFGATGGAAGSLGVWVGTGATSGSITAGATTALNGGSISDSLTAAAIGAGVGAVAGAVGNRIAVGSAIAAVRRGSGVTSAITRGDRFGSVGGAASGVGLSGLANGLGSSGKRF